MEVTERSIVEAREATATLRRRGYATAARYSHEAGRLIVSLHNGVELAVPTRLVEGLAGAGAEALSGIEISPSGLDLHWPALDADVYVPGLLDGVFGTRSWMAELEAEGVRETRPGTRDMVRTVSARSAAHRS